MSFGIKVVFLESSGPPLSGNSTFMLKFGGPIKWEPILAVYAGSFAPEVVLEAGILISKQTALWTPIKLSKPTSSVTDVSAFE